MGAPVEHRAVSEQPWLRPCAGDGEGGSIPREVLQGITIPRIPEWDDPSKFAHEMLILLAGTEQMIEELSGFLV